MGCFSFQTSKTISCGEGGAILGDDEELMDKCYTVQNHGTSKRGRTEVAGPKYRMNEFEGAVLLGTTQDMDDVVNAIFKVHENRDKLGSR